MSKVLLFAVGINSIILNEKIELLKQAIKSDGIDENDIVIKQLVADRRKIECGLEIINEIKKNSEIEKVYISSQNDLSSNLGKIKQFFENFSDMGITVVTCEQNT